ncbi:MAG: SGNH hydrolase-type esterase domain-containing protein [Monoraphidium minutum]|nr:MAG: SGNH hydrolase-type esterase domain-containing protein [Monoraphidium minutum]
MDAAGAAAPGAAGGPRTLLCVGDSHTEAILGTDWVGRLAAATRSKLGVVRAGKGGQWAVLIRRRLEALLEAHPDADGAVILAGTNDVIASLGARKLAFYRLVFPALRRAEATLAAYESEMDAMLRALCAPRAGGAAAARRVAVVTLPPAGEDLTDAANQTVRRYNAALARVVARYAPAARLVDFYGACAAHLAAVPGRAPPPGLPGMSLWWMGFVQGRALVQRYVLRRGWDYIARYNGLELLTDHVHLSERAGVLLLQALRPFVDDLVAGG